MDVVKAERDALSSVLKRYEAVGFGDLSDR